MKRILILVVALAVAGCAETGAPVSEAEYEAERDARIDKPDFAVRDGIMEAGEVVTDGILIYDLIKLIAP